MGTNVGLAETATWFSPATRLAVDVPHGSAATSAPAYSSAALAIRLVGDVTAPIVMSGPLPQGQDRS